MLYHPIDPQLFITNRKRLAAEMKPDSIAIFNANDQFPRNGDQFQKFRQNSDLFWASGLDQEKTIVVLYPDAPLKKFREMAFLVKTNEMIAIWEGHKYTIEEARQVSGIQSIHWLEDFEMVLHELLNYATDVYLNKIEFYKFKTDVPYRDVRFGEKIRKEYPEHNYHRLAPLVTKLRLIKQPIEIELLKKACAITNKAFQRVLRFTKPEVWEFEIEAEISHEFTRNRANGHAYDPIVAAGENALCLHYNTNTSQCRSGDLLLFDFGAEYANYAADLSRTIPVNSKFNPRQRAVYNSVLKVWKEAKTKVIRKGVTIEQINNEVNKLIEKECIALGLFTEEDVKKQDPEKPLYSRYFMHGTSHFIGLDVHDVGHKQIVLQPGMVLTCEPGIYITEEKLGVRIESDILVTETGTIDLMDDIPVEVEDIERLMLQSGSK